MEEALDKDINRIIKIDKKTLEINKKIRKKKRAIRKGYIDSEHEQEGGGIIHLRKSLNVWK